MCAGRQQPDIISWMMGLLFIIYINAGTEAGCTRAVTMVKTHIDHYCKWRQKYLPDFLKYLVVVEATSHWELLWRQYPEMKLSLTRYRSMLTVQYIFLMIDLLINTFSELFRFESVILLVIFVWVSVRGLRQVTAYSSSLIFPGSRMFVSSSPSSSCSSPSSPPMFSRWQN